MKVKEKAAFALMYGVMLTPGMRECKPDIYWLLAKVNRTAFLTFEPKLQSASK